MNTPRLRREGEYLLHAYFLPVVVLLLRAFSELLIRMLHQFGLGCIKNGAL